MRIKWGNTNNVINTYSQGLAQGLILSGGDYIVKSNKFYAYSDIGTEGIMIFCQTRGVIEYNNISLSSKSSSYGIRSNEYSKCDMNYTGNNIAGRGYYSFAFSLSGVSNVIDNTVNLEGNYSTGLAFYGEKLNVSNNRFYLKSNENGKTSPLQRLMIEAVGIKLLSGKITVLNNYISTPGKGISIGTNRVLIETDHTFSMDYTNTTKTHVIRAPCDSNMKVYLADNNINVLSGDNEDVYGILAVTGNVTYKNNIVNVENITSPGSYDDLYELINNAAENSVIVLDRDYCAYGSCQCLEIDKNLTIDGNGHTIDYKHQAYTITLQR